MVKLRTKVDVPRSATIGCSGPTEPMKLSGPIEHVQSENAQQTRTMSVKKKFAMFSLMVDGEKFRMVRVPTRNKKNDSKTLAAGPINSKQKSDPNGPRDASDLPIQNRQNQPKSYKVPSSIYLKTIGITLNCAILAMLLFKIISYIFDDWYLPKDWFFPMTPLYLLLTIGSIVVYHSDSVKGLYLISAMWIVINLASLVVYWLGQNNITLQLCASSIPICLAVNSVALLLPVATIKVLMNERLQKQRSAIAIC